MTLGNPATLTGGYLYHRRLARLAPSFDARLDFVSVPDRPFPLPAVSGPAVLRAARHAADVVVIDSIAAAFTAPVLHRYRPSPVTVAMLHQPPGGIDHGRVRALAQRILDQHAYRQVRRLLVASQALGDQLRTAGYPADRIRVVPPGRDLAPTPVLPDGDLRRGRAVAVVSVGNWVRRKGLLDLLEAVARMPTDALTLHLVGDPDVEPRYAAGVWARLREPDLGDRVEVHGPQPLERVAGFYAAADVFALASRIEPYGTVYGEAMAAGLPVVGWAAGNLPHLARDGRDGFTVPTGDRQALEQALWRLASDPGLRARMAASARRRAAAFPTWEETARRFFAELRSAIDG